MDGLSILVNLIRQKAMSICVLEYGGMTERVEEQR